LLIDFNAAPHSRGIPARNFYAINEWLQLLPPNAMCSQVAENLHANIASTCRACAVTYNNFVEFGCDYFILQVIMQ
jgi:hypothetical protein